MKKLILTTSILLGLSSIANAGTMPIVYPEYDTISFTLDANTMIKSDTALVNVTVNTTTLANDKAAKDSSIDTLKKILPKPNWKIVNYTQIAATFGAINIKVIIQAKLTQSQINILRKSLTNQSDNQKMTLNVLNHNPTKIKIQEAKENLMIGMYQNIQRYVTKLNTKTHNNFHIQHVNYNTNTVNNNRPVPRTMFAANVGSLNKSTNNVEVSRKISLSAYVTLAKKPKK